MDEPQSVDLKQTVNLPKTAFSMKANLPQAEPKTLARWEKERLYHQIRGIAAGRPRYILHDGPPYANGRIHLGTAFNKILKDFIVKSKTMAGFDAPYVPGWDCHGLPIEINVDNELGAKKAHVSPLEIRRACRLYAEKYVDLQRTDFKRLGVLGQWEDPYLTMSAHYQSVIAGAFVDFLEKGYVYKGLKPVHWCIKDRTALAEAEVEYENDLSPSIWVRFRLMSDAAAIDPALAERAVYGLIWTTTPWTIPANVAIAFQPEVRIRGSGSGRRGVHRGRRFTEGHGGEMRLGGAARVGDVPRRQARPRGVPPSVSGARFAGTAGRSRDARTRHRRGSHGAGTRPGRLRERAAVRHRNLLPGGRGGTVLSRHGSGRAPAGGTDRQDGLGRQPAGDRNPEGARRAARRWRSWRTRIRTAGGATSR